MSPPFETRLIQILKKISVITLESSRSDVPLSASSSAQSVIICMRTLGLNPGCSLFIGIIRRRTVTLRLRSQMTSRSSAILHTTSALLFVVLGGVWLHPPRTARGHVNTRRQTGAHSVRGCRVLCWPLARLTAAPTRFTRNV